MAEDKESRPSPVDVHVGARIRLRRTLLGLSQERLGDALGLTFQQIQKYERGVNRVGASRLFDLSRVLDVPISFFYDNMPKDNVPTASTFQRPQPSGFAEHQPEFGNDDIASSRETFDLMRAYYRITDPGVRKRVIDLMKSMGPPTPD